MWGSVPQSIAMVVFGHRLDSMMSQGFSKLTDSVVIASFYSVLVRWHLEHGWFGVP